MRMKTEKRSRKQGRRPYRAPRLVNYGSLQQLTTAKGAAANDGALKPATKASGQGT